MIPYEQLVEAISRWKAERQAAEAGTEAPADPTNGQQADGLVPEELVEAEAVVTEEADAEEAAEIVEPDPDPDPE